MLTYRFSISVGLDIPDYVTSENDEPINQIGEIIKRFLVYLNIIHIIFFLECKQPVDVNVKTDWQQ